MRRTSAIIAACAVLLSTQVTTALAQDSLPPELRAATASLEAGRIDAAIDAAQRYTRFHSHDPRGFILLGRAYQHRLPQGRFRAIRAYQRAERLDPTDPEPSYRTAMIGFATGGGEGERQAEDGLARTLGRDPLYRNAWEIWLALFRRPSSRRDVLKRMWPHRDQPEVRVRIAQLLVEDERYAEADSLLDVSLATDSTNVAWLALAAQSAFEAGDTLRGTVLYHRALDNAEHDSTEALWKQVVGIASPEELKEWARVSPGDRKAWLGRFWARRNPDLFRSTNVRIAEHFARLREARSKFPLLHPLVGFELDTTQRVRGLAPSQGEIQRFRNCETGDLPGGALATGFGIAPLDYGEPIMPVQYRGGVGWWLAEEARAKIPDWPLARDMAPAFDPAVYEMLQLATGGADSSTGRVGYNLATGLSDRGLAYLRFGRPDRMILGGNNAMNPNCNTRDLEYWDYDRVGRLRFAPLPPRFKKRGLSAGIGFRPMLPDQFRMTRRVLTQERSSVPAPLKFGVWFARFPGRAASGMTDLAVITTTGAIAASLVTEPDEGVQIHQDGIVTFSARPGVYPLVVDAREDGVLGRQKLRVTLPHFVGDSALSDLLLGAAWAERPMSRRDMLAHVRRTLTFSPSDTVRAYAEIAGLDSGARYRATYLLLKTDDVPADYAKDDWPSAIRFEFERRVSPNDRSVTPEVLDILPRWIPPGTYLLRLEVRDSPSTRLLGRATVAFEVRE